MTEWNHDQQKVLDSRREQRNILVSAAAGSGKTAVLVERIVETVLEGDCGIDEILVVTFTRAAAAQMKDKIIRALEKEAEKENDLRARQQLQKAEQADILTIDAFCGRVVRENFSIAGIDPGFQTMDAEEEKLLLADTLDDILDAELLENEDFRELAGFFLENHVSLDSLREVILKINRTADGFADPDAWISRAKQEAEAEGADQELLDRPWMQNYLSEQLRIMDGVSEKFLALAEPYRQETDPDKAETAEKISRVLTEDAAAAADYAAEIRKQTTYEGVAAASRKKPAYALFQKKKYQDFYPEDEIKNLDDTIKKLKTKVKLALDPPEDFAAEAAVTAKQSLLLLSCTEKFRDALMQEKMRRKQFAFSDIAHFAYRILFDREKGETTEAGRRYTDRYQYIYIDEYQDSSDMQENILTAVARKRQGHPANIFMVGDVKQSIYRFRLARPQLFTEKEKEYGRNGDTGLLLRLNTNYRSRGEILDGVNRIFRQIMTEEFGGIAYDEDAALHTPEKAVYEKLFPPADPEIKGRVGGPVEIHVIAEASEVETVGKPETEALFISRKIREITEGAEGVPPLYIRNEGFLPDQPESPENPRYRKAQYRDIVILQRTVKGMSGAEEVYRKQGIPVQVDDKTGYFDANEIMTVLDCLSAVDNRHNDIPYATVLRSMIGGLTDGEMALITAAEDAEHPEETDRDFSDKAVQFAADFADFPDYRDTVGKITRVNRMLESWREDAPFLRLRELIDRILRDTGLDTFAALMPAGKIRKANLDMLKIRAEHFEASEGRSLSGFLRYIEKCRLHDVDFGVSEPAEEAGNVVRICTIHSSKGLEYPVVILAGLGRQFNNQDDRAKVLVSPDYYLGLNIMKKEDLFRIIRKGRKRSILNALEKNASLAESMRLLYVGMTRAEEKLILTGVMPVRKGEEQDTRSWIESHDSGYLSRVTAKSLLDLVLDGISQDREAYVLGEADGNVLAAGYQAQITDEAAVRDRAVEQVLRDLRKAEEDLPEAESPYAFRYTYERETRQKAKMSVSEVKERAVEEKRAEIRKEAREESKEEKTVELQPNRKQTAAAARGTAVHKIFELLHYEKILTREDLEQDVRDILADPFFRGISLADEVKKIYDFYSEDPVSLFQRMRRACLTGTLRREQQFIAGFSPAEIPGGVPVEDISGDGDITAVYSTDGENWESGDLITLQGVIDAFFQNPDGSLTLVDYKTDHVQSGDVLRQQYDAQLQLYKMALEKLTKRQVKEKIIYSLPLGEISLGG